MDKLVGRKFGEAEIKALLRASTRYTFDELRDLASPAISDYYIEKWMREAGKPRIKLQQPPNLRKKEQAKLPPSNRKLIWITASLGILLGVVGLVLNGKYAYQFGSTPDEKWISTTTGVLIDLVSMFGLTLAWALPLYVKRLSAIVVWLLAVGYSFLVAVGFFATLLGDHARHGLSVDQYRADLSAAIELKNRELAKLANRDIDSEAQAEAERLNYWFRDKWRSSDGCHKDTISADVCGKLKQLRDEKKAKATLPAEIVALQEKRFALPNVSGQDSIGETVGTISIGAIKPEGVNIYRRIVPALFLAFSGLLLAYSRELDK